jgi:hypothetical protein
VDVFFLGTFYRQVEKVPSVATGVITPLHQDCFDDFVDGKSQNHTRI